MKTGKTISNTKIRQARVGGELTPTKISFKMLKKVLDFSIILNHEETAQMFPPEAWEEIEHRLREIQKKIDRFIAARKTTSNRDQHSGS